ncbi:MAG TPA: VWA domain-containing protein [Gemmatimonadaceae bacterium]
MTPSLQVLQFVERPVLLVLAVLLPIAISVLLRRANAQRRLRLAKLGALDVVRRLVPPTAFTGGGWRAVRLGLAAACAGIAIAGPRWGYEPTTVRSSGVDLVLAVDASLSMMATDVKPTRLEQVKQEIRQLRAISPGDRVGLLAFAGRSYVLSPITVDGGALDLFLDNLDPSIVGQAGSSIAQTIVQGTSLLALSKSGADRALVIMSDGEAFEPQDDIIAAAKRAAENNVRLVTVGFGTTQGGTIPVKGSPNGYKQDANGQTVITKYHPELLQAAAQAANGTFIPAEATDKAARIKSALSRLRTQARTSQTGDTLTPRYQWFLLPAVLLIWLDTVLGGRRGNRRRRAAAAETAVAAALVGSVMLGGCAQSHDARDGVAAYKAKNYQQAASLLARAVRDDKSPGTLYNYGTALLALDSTGPAAEVLTRAADKGDAEVQYRARFNAGLAHLVRGLGAHADSGSQELKLALADYKRVLIRRPTDLDAKWNYELALEKQKKGGGGGGGGASNSSPQQSKPEPKPQPTQAQRQAEQILGSAQREERDVQSKKQKQSRQEPPPGGKDW